jgi:hypothetical protein
MEPLPNNPVEVVNSPHFVLDAKVPDPWRGCGLLHPTTLLPPASPLHLIFVILVNKTKGISHA